EGGCLSAGAVDGTAGGYVLPAGDQAGPDWRAVCGKIACTVSEGGVAKAIPTPIRPCARRRHACEGRGEETVCQIEQRNLGTRKWTEPLRHPLDKIRPIQGESPRLWRDIQSNSFGAEAWNR